MLRLGCGSPPLHLEIHSKCKRCSAYYIVSNYGLHAGAQRDPARSVQMCSMPRLLSRPHAHGLRMQLMLRDSVSLLRRCAYSGRGTRGGGARRSGFRAEPLPHDSHLHLSCAEYWPLPAPSSRGRVPNPQSAALIHSSACHGPNRDGRAGTVGQASHAQSLALRRLVSSSQAWPLGGSLDMDSQESCIGHAAVDSMLTNCACVSSIVAFLCPVLCPTLGFTILYVT